MRGLTKKVVGRLRSMVGALRVSQDDLVLFNVDTPVYWIDYFRKLVRHDRADGILVNGAHPHMPHTVVDRVQRVYMAT